MDYDVVIVGARPAGAATAMLLARAGLRVLTVDQARFPSDTLSTHQVQLPGVALLARWGLLDKIAASNCPPTRDVRFDPGPAVLTGRFPAYQGVDALFSPRRTVLDTILAGAARDAGAEVMEGFRVDEILMSGGRATGITGVPRGPGAGNAPVTITARLIIGADGKHSTVARAVSAAEYHQQPALSAAVYTYWSGLPASGGEIYARDRRAIGVWPTNDGLVMTYVAMPAADFAAFRADLDTSFLATLDMAGDLGERARSAERAERFRATSDLPNVFRRPYGPGWALVGDAGLVMDPITGQGIGHALRDAEALALAVAAGLAGSDRDLNRALAAYHRHRDAATLPMYRFTTRLAGFAADPAGEILFPVLARDQARTDEFLGVLTGAVPAGQYFSGRAMARLLGVRGMIAVARSRGRGRRQQAGESAPHGQLITARGGDARQSPPQHVQDRRLAEDQPLGH